MKAKRPNTMIPANRWLLFLLFLVPSVISKAQTIEVLVEMDEITNNLFSRCQPFPIDIYSDAPSGSGYWYSYSNYMFTFDYNPDSGEMEALDPGSATISLIVGKEFSALCSVNNGYIRTPKSLCSSFLENQYGQYEYRIKLPFSEDPSTPTRMKIYLSFNAKSPNISFKDPEVKRICVEEFDFNGDGEISYNEARAVRIGNETDPTLLNKNMEAVNPFSGNTKIKSFDEFAYFSNITQLPDGFFKGCKSLKSVTLPKNLYQIGKEAFHTCYKLSSIHLPNSIDIIKEMAFYACTGLTSVKLPLGLRKLEKKSFYYNTRLESVTIPSCNIIEDGVFSACSAIREVTTGIENPFVIPNNTFSESVYTNAVLTVPPSTKSLYAKTGGWKKFQTVNVSDNPYCIELDWANIIAGEREVLKFQAKLPEYRGFQADILLSENLSLEDINEVDNSYTPQIEQIGPNEYRVISYRNNYSTFYSDPSLFQALETIPVRVIGNCVGQETITLKNMVVTGNDYNSIKIPDYTAIITVDNPILREGDADMDFSVDVDDVVACIDYIMGKSPIPFSFINADCNHDNTIDVSDVVYIAKNRNALNNKSTAPAHAPMISNNMLTLTEGPTFTLNVTDASQYLAGQMTLTVEEGMTLSNMHAGDSHMVTYEQVDGTTYAITIYSLTNEAFSDTTPILTFDVQGTGQVSVNNVLLVDTSREKHEMGGIVGNATGISSLTIASEQSGYIYSISGQLVRMNANTVEGLAPGIYIVNGKKIQVR